MNSAINNCLQPLESFLNNSPELDITNFTEEVMDSIFILLNYGKIGLDRNVISTIKKVKTKVDLENIKSLYFDARFSKNTLITLHLGKNEIDDYKSSRLQMFQFLDKLIEQIGLQGYHDIFKQKYRRFIYFDKLNIHIIEVFMKEYPLHKEDRYRLRYLVF